MKRFLIIWLVSFTWAQAQHVSPLGRFSLPYEKACTPITISVIYEDNFGNVPRTYIYEDGLIDVTDTFYTYTKPGIYEIVQITGANITTKTDTLVFEVVEPRPPQFDLFKCTSTEVQIEITDTYYDYYIVKWTNSDSVVITATDPPPGYDYGLSSGSVQVIGRFNNAYANCSDTFRAFTLTEPVDASVISSNISVGCQGEYFINLTTSTDSLTRYQISVEQNGTYTSVYEGKVITGQSSYELNFDPSQPNYCVRISKLNACTGTTISGTESCYTLDEAALLPLSNSYATYSGAGIYISIDPTTSNQISVYRKYGSTGSFGYLRSVQNSFTDAVGSHFRAYEYELTQQDTCGTVIDSAIVGAPYLKIIDKNRHTNEIELSITEPLNQFVSDYEHTLIIYNSDSSASTEIPFETNFTLPAQIGDQLNLVARYFYPAENISIYSNTISTSYEFIVYIPDAFTPDSDGLNDQLELFGLPTNDFELSVYNRWGELIHKKSDENPAWDGRIGDKVAPQGTYRYKLVFTLADGKLKTQVGTFVLLKK